MSMNAVAMIPNRKTALFAILLSMKEETAILSNFYNMYSVSN
jgi:hypothetical protein